MPAQPSPTYGRSASVTASDVSDVEYGACYAPHKPVKDERNQSLPTNQRASIFKVMRSQGTAPSSMDSLSTHGLECQQSKTARKHRSMTVHSSTVHHFPHAGPRALQRLQATVPAS
eukprot:6197831-Pleurochrysis_carterae.AAC.2